MNTVECVLSRASIIRDFHDLKSIRENPFYSSF